VGKGEGRLVGMDSVGRGTPEGEQGGRPEGMDSVGKGTPEGRPEGRDPVGEGPFKPRREMGMMLKLSPRRLEIIWESEALIWERMELESNPPASPPPDSRVTSRPMERGDCPITTVTFTMLPGPTTTSRTMGMSCWRMVDWSPKPMVTLMLRGPTSMRLLRSRSRSAMMLLRLRPAMVLLRSRPAMVVLRSRPAMVVLRLRPARMSMEIPPS